MAAVVLGGWTVLALPLGVLVGRWLRRIGPPGRARAARLGRRAARGRSGPPGV